jgi:phage/plasmid-associated DNA primase
MSKISKYAIPYIEYQIAGIQLSVDESIMIKKLKNKVLTTKDQRGIFTQMEIRLPKNNQFIKEKFNKTPHLFPIRNNKIIDFKTDTVRNRSKKDYFTFYVDIEYDKDVNEKLVIDWVTEYLIPKGKVLDEDDYNHIDCFLDFQGYLCTGENNLKAVAIYKGKKDSGKSTLTKKINKTFGGDDKFISTVHKKVFCESKSSSVHESELFKLKFSRVGFFSELKEDDKPNEDFIKRVSGNDKFIPARKCGSAEQESLILDFKIVIPTNHIWDSSDPALQSRMKFFEFPNFFDKDAPNVEEIEEYINNLDVASVIFKRAHKFYLNKKTIKWSKQVNYFSTHEITQLDPIKQFLNDFFILTDDDKDRIAMSDIFELFKNENPANELSKHKNRFIKKFEENLPRGNNRINKTYFRKISYKNSVKKEE